MKVSNQGVMFVCLFYFVSFWLGFNMESRLALSLHDPPASTSPVLELQAWATTPSPVVLFLISYWG